MSNGPGPSKCRLLLVEDDESLGGAVADYFMLKGYEVDVVTFGLAFRSYFSQPGSNKVDMILLDLNLPDADGLDLLSSLRRNSRIPVFIVSGRIDQDSRLTGLEEGADDYIVKPFDIRELELRIRNFLQRRQESGAQPSTGQAVLRFGPWRLDPELRRAYQSDGAAASLTAGECALLVELIASQGRPVRRERIVAQLVSNGIQMTEESLPVLVSRLRAKLGADEKTPLIIAVPGQGYRIEVVRPTGL